MKVLGPGGHTPGFGEGMVSTDVKSLTGRHQDPGSTPGFSITSEAVRTRRQGDIRWILN